MKTFKKYIDAENYAKEVSAKELRHISIVRLPKGKRWKDGHNSEFVVFEKNEWSWGVEHVMLITNYETLFEVRYTSPKSGVIIQGFPTKELRDIRYKELVSDKYWKDIFTRDLSQQQYFDEYVKPYEKSRAISEEYRKKMLML